MDSFELELKQGFLEEATQLLEEAEQYFLALETRRDDISVIESIFRLAHNFKGSSRAVGFDSMADFSHKLESFLLKIKNKELEVTTEAVNLLLRCNDHLKMMVDEMKKDFGALIDSSELLTELEQRTDGSWVETGSATAEGASVEFPAESNPAFPDASAFGDETSEAQAQQSGESVAAEASAVDSTSGPSHQDESAVSAAPVVDNVVPLPTRAGDHTASAEGSRAAQGKTGGSGAANAVEETIRVSLGKVEKLINNVGELVIMQTVLSQNRHLIQNDLLRKTIAEVSKITKEIQDISMSMRMIPLKQTFQKMQRIVRDTSKILGKEVQLETSGEETELDKTVLENLGDPLVHLIRNAVDHGLESTEERVRLGKPAAGTVSLSAYYRGSHIVIEVRDDGKGLDPQKLRQKAIEKGVIREDAVLSDNDCYQLIFAAGFSTKTEVSDISGRGVGLDVVRTNVEKLLHGEIQIETELGKGTVFRVLLPLTLAIIDGMIIEIGTSTKEVNGVKTHVEGERYVIPLGHVHETLKPDRENVHFVTGLGEVLSLRGEELPLFPLSLLLGRKGKPRPPCESIALVVRAGERPFSILVDDIIGQQQVVVKRLGRDIQHIRGFSGGAILGDGRASVILDLIELVERVQSLGPIQKEAVGWA